MLFLYIPKERRKAITVAELSALQEVLGLFFNDPSLLERALVHRSYVNEYPDSAPISNERLEFLGDAVLGLVVAEKLFRDFSKLTEGKMTKLRAALVCQDTLARIAGTIELGDYLYLGKGEEASGGRHKEANLARVLEAVIGAVYLDQGLVSASDFISRLFSRELKKVARWGAGVDYKSRLQEAVQARGQTAPVYKVIEEEGPDHDKRFTVEVRVGKKVLGKGSGKSKKTAEVAAAHFALGQFAVDFTE